jgi:cell division protein FtsW
MFSLFSHIKLDKRPVDYPLAFIAGLLIVVGLFVFFSASLQALGQTMFNRLMITQLVYSLVVGGSLLYGFSHFSYKNLAQWALPAVVIAGGLCVLVFVPGIGMSHGGGQRWLNLGFTNLQPSEFLKFTTIIFLSAWFAKSKRKMDDWRYGLLVLCLVAGAAGVLLFLQKDIGTLSVIIGSAFALFAVSNAPLKHIGISVLLGIFVFASAIIFLPHVRARVMTFTDFKDPQGAGWQVRQSLIAVGSGGIAGRGYLQSVQRFSYLPEAHGDSIFAVAAEELGFVGASFIILLYISFALRSLKVAMRAPDDFSMFLAVGFLSMIMIQSALNIGSVLGVIPFTGVPLVFMSQGGTALVVAMSAVGVILNISRNQRIQ